MTALLAALYATPALLAVSLVVSVLAAIYAYGAANRFRLVAGVNPWRVPAWIWALLVFLAWLPVLILFFLARATTRPSDRSTPTRADYPARNQPARSSGRDLSGRDHGLGSSHPPPAHLPPAGWYPDPGGRHELRYWDGRGWTAYVSDQGVRSEDPG